jgi:glycosyltransferase involved in cell wall biosynthesis
MKIAIVHDWFVGGGAESVVYELHKMYPQAPIYTSYCSPEWQRKLTGTKVITSYMQHWPFSRLRKFLPVLRAIWFSRLKLDGYDLVISSSGAEAKAVRIKKPGLHINYCHAPTHYYWSRYEQYMKSPGFGLFDPLARLGLRFLVSPMRRWDRKAARRPDFMIANSNFTKEQIKKYYGREAEVIHPPVDVERFKPGSKSSIARNGFLIAGRQTPYKRFDLAVQACSKLNLPLTVLGQGPDNKRLKKMAGPTINFVGWVSDEERIKYFQSAEAFLFPGIDDFGVVAVEALAAGTPVIAYKAGGALDYVTKDSGLLFDEQTPVSLAHAIESFNKKRFDHSQIAKSALQFRAGRFDKQILGFITNTTN